MLGRMCNVPLVLPRNLLYPLQLWKGLWAEGYCHVPVCAGRAAAEPANGHLAPPVGSTQPQAHHGFGYPVCNEWSFVG